MRVPFEAPKRVTSAEAQLRASVAPKAVLIAVPLHCSGPRRCHCRSPGRRDRRSWAATSDFGQPQSNGCAYFAVVAQPITGTVKSVAMPRVFAAPSSALAPLFDLGSEGTGLQ